MAYKSDLHIEKARNIFPAILRKLDRLVLVLESITVTSLYKRGNSTDSRRKGGGITIKDLLLTSLISRFIIDTRVLFYTGSRL